MASSSTVDVLDLERQVCFALAVASRRVISLYRPLLEPMGLTHPQYLVMLALWQQGASNVTALGERLSLDPATLSPLLKRLELAGYITRKRDSDDERILVVTLTPAGRRLRKAALKIPPAIMNRLDMDAAELMELHSRLTDVIARAQDGTATS